MKNEAPAMVTLYSDSLMLRTVHGGDAGEVARMWEWLEGPISLEKAGEAIANMEVNHRLNKPGHIHHLCLAVFEKGSDRIIGWCGLDGKWTPGKVVLFYSIDTEYQRRGYATQCALRLFEYAFESVGLEIVHSGCFKDNTASFRVMEKAGMILLGQDEESGDPQFYIDKMTYEQNKKGFPA